MAVQIDVSFDSGYLPSVFSASLKPKSRGTLQLLVNGMYRQRHSFGTYARCFPQGFAVEALRN